MKGCTTKSFIFRHQQKKSTCISASACGADGRIRTGDLILTKDALYRLSYISASFDARFIILYSTPKSKGFFKFS